MLLSLCHLKSPRLSVLNDLGVLRCTFLCCQILERRHWLCVCPCLITAGLYTTLGMVSTYDQPYFFLHFTNHRLPRRLSTHYRTAWQIPSIHISPMTEKHILLCIKDYGEGTHSKHTLCLLEVAFLKESMRILFTALHSFYCMAKFREKTAKLSGNPQLLTDAPMPAAHQGRLRQRLLLHAGCHVRGYQNGFARPG